MKIFAQSGYSEGEKVKKGLENKYIDGVIYSPQNISPDKLQQKIDELRGGNDQSEILFDPQFYSTPLKNDPQLKLRKLNEYTDYYFSFESKNRLEREKNVINVLTKTINYQNTLQLTSIIAPNILISKSFDSIEGVISKNFIRLTKEVQESVGSEKDTFASIVISTEALSNSSELQDFLSSITILESPPDGFYILISSRNNDNYNEVLDSNVLAGWMLLNYSLKTNGFKVINGYSDILSPYLASVGAYAGGFGWWNTLRIFSINQLFTPPKREGGSLPVQKYFSKKLLNRIRFDELDALRTDFPEIVNGLKTDEIFINQSEPDRSEEVLQHWQSLQSLTEEFNSENLKENLENILNKISEASQIYDKINTIYRLEPKSGNYHLELIDFAIERFKRLAEV